MSYLIDTDIIIYSLKGNTVVKNRFSAKEIIPKAISIITYGELLLGLKIQKMSTRTWPLFIGSKNCFRLLE